jgi:hypothetical protein
VNRQRAIEQQQTFMDAATAEHKQLVKLMREHNISGSADSALMQRTFVRPPRFRVTDRRDKIPQTVCRAAGRGVKRDARRS